MLIHDNLRGVTALRRLAVFVSTVVGEEHAGFAVLFWSLSTSSAGPAGIDEATDANGGRLS
jgi:hypothetical protein